MKKSVKNLLILVLVLAVLGGVTAALLLWPQPEEPKDPASQAATPSGAPLASIFPRLVSEVESITVENSAGGYRMYPMEDTGGALFNLEGYENYGLLSSALANTAQCLFYSTTARELGPQGKLEDFGLAGEAAAEITIDYNDGTSEEVVLGNNAGETAGRYVLKDGEVYIISGVSDYFFSAPEAFVNTYLYEIADRVADEDETVYENVGVTDILYSMTLSGTHFPNTIEMKSDPSVLSSYKITAPVTADAGNEYLETVIADLKALNADSVAAVGLTEETLEKYGLAEPFAKIEFDLNREKHTLAVSAASGGNRYLLFDDRDVVYQIAQSSVASWAESDLLKLRLTYVIVPRINDIQRLEYIVEDDMVYAFDVTREVNPDTSTEARVNYDLTVTRPDGETLDTENYRHLFTRMMGTAMLTSDPTEYDKRTRILTIKFTYFEGGTDTVEYYAAGSDRYAAVLNGEFNGICRASELDSAIAYLPVLNDGGEVPSVF